MKRFLWFIFLSGVLTFSSFSEVEYSKKPSGFPGLFFVQTLYSPSVSLSLTNTEERMWYPSLIEVGQTALWTNTITVYIENVISTNQYRGNVVWTNEFDEVLTNYNWGVTNILTRTNSHIIGVISVTDVTTGRVSFVDEYLQKMDVLKITCSTNLTWLKIIGKE